MVVKSILFVVIALFIFLMFRSELRSLKSHGFYVFFAFEGLLVLLFFNLEFWSAGGILLNYLISWIFLIVSALLAFSGFYGLKKYGKPLDDWENTTYLIRRGIFRYIRHPLYSSLMLLSIGIFLKHVSWVSAIACCFSVVFLVAASKVEERENIEKFGENYHSYIGTTKNYIPFII
jgi:protein-S-isoprenylcysteine O-methyltransferase Ste14